jgi:hypothetical protein
MSDHDDAPPNFDDEEPEDTTDYERREGEPHYETKDLS